MLERGCWRWLAMPQNAEVRRPIRRPARSECVPVPEPFGYWLVSHGLLRNAFAIRSRRPASCSIDSSGACESTVVLTLLDPRTLLQARWTTHMACSTRATSPMLYSGP